MGPAEGHEGRHLIPFCDYDISINTEVWESGVQPPDKVLVPVDALLLFWHHVACEIVRCYELVGGFWVVLVPDLLVQAAHEGLVLFRHSFLLPQATPHEVL